MKHISNEKQKQQKIFVVILFRTTCSLRPLCFNSNPILTPRPPRPIIYCKKKLILFFLFYKKIIQNYCIFCLFSDYRPTTSMSLEQKHYNTDHKQQHTNKNTFNNATPVGNVSFARGNIRRIQRQFGTFRNDRHLRHNQNHTKQHWFERKRVYLTFALWRGHQLDFHGALGGVHVQHSARQPEEFRRSTIENVVAHMILRTYVSDVVFGFKTEKSY